MTIIKKKETIDIYFHIIYLFLLTFFFFYEAFYLAFVKLCIYKGYLQILVLDL